MPNELGKMKSYLSIILKRITDLRWGHIVIDIQRGLPVRIREERTFKLDGDEEDLWEK